MNKIPLLFLGAVLSITICQASPKDATPPHVNTLRTTSGDSLSLSDCITLALKQNPRLLPLEAQIASLKIALQNSKEAFFPAINGSIGQNISFGRSQGNDGVYRSINNTATSIGIGAQVTLFDGGAMWYSLKKNRAALNNTPLILEDAQSKVALTIAEDYLNYVLSNEMISVAELNLKLIRQRLKETQSMIALGKMAVSNEILIKTQEGEALQTLQDAKAEKEKAYYILLLDMGFTNPNTMPLISIINSKEVQQYYQEITIDSGSTSFELAGTRLAHERFLQSQYDINIAKASWWPKLSLDGSYSNGYFYNFGKDIPNNSNLSFRDQINGNGRTQIGITLSIPIYSRGQIRHSIQQAKLNSANYETTWIQQKHDDARNLLLAQVEHRKALDQNKIAKENTELASQSLNIAELEYNAGRITLYEWESAKNKVIQAEANYLRTLYSIALRSVTLHYLQTGKIPLPKR